MDNWHMMNKKKESDHRKKLRFFFNVLKFNLLPLKENELKF